MVEVSRKHLGDNAVAAAEIDAEVFGAAVVF
jgi:hypothetical protein